MEKVSIIIPFYNCSYVQQAIESALQQTYSNIEVIVVNDGSTIHTEKVTPYLDRIRYIEKKNGGTASALNVGIQHATGDYFAWLSSDDLFVHDKVEKQLRFMKAHNAYISHSNYALINNNSEVTVPLAGVYFDRKLDFIEHLQIGCSVNGCTIMMKMDVFSTLGLFNETLRFTQDYDYWLRCVPAYEFYYLNEPLVHYRVHEEMGTKKHTKEIEREIKAVQESHRSVLNNMVQLEKGSSPGLINSLASQSFSQPANKPLNITFPILTLCKGGAQRMLADISNGLVDLGHNVTILMPPQGDIEYDVKAKITRTPGAVITEQDYPNSDLIISNFYSTVPSAAAASAQGKGIHARFSLCYEPVFLPEQSVSFQSYNTTPYLLVISRYQQELISLLHGIKGEHIPIYVNPNFSKLSLSNKRKPLTISAIVRIPEGGYSWQRDQDYLIEQLKVVKKQFPSVRINLICPPNEFAQSPMLQDLRNKEGFLFYSPKDDYELCAYYNRADIFVTSSIYETAVLPGLEAMKCGAAIVGVYAGGNTEYGRHEETCLMSYRYENRLGEDIIRLIQDPALLAKLKNNGEQEAERWQLSNSVAAFEKACYSFLQDAHK
ncbi:glycosyltransferase [Priestia flexa]|uniref:glycosyltransferase n=1 Tax=Priestia TaxID=2800373 RepID=UPI00211B3091|nr:glycosyltransferase [Bacillus sp. 1780r2a1]